MKQALGSSAALAASGLYPFSRVAMRCEEWGAPEKEVRPRRAPGRVELETEEDSGRAEVAQHNRTDPLANHIGEILQNRGQFQDRPVLAHSQ